MGAVRQGEMQRGCGEEPRRIGSENVPRTDRRSPKAVAGMAAEFRTVAREGWCDLQIPQPAPPEEPNNCTDIAQSGFF